MSVIPGQNYIRVDISLLLITFNTADTGWIISKARGMSTLGSVDGDRTFYNYSEQYIFQSVPAPLYKADMAAC